MSVVAPVDRPRHHDRPRPRREPRSHLEGVLEAIEGAITVQGTLEAPWTGECRRCLDDVAGTVSIEVSEVFETRPVPGETYALEGDELDLEPLVRDNVLLNLPLAPLCRTRLPGPGPRPVPGPRRRATSRGLPTTAEPSHPATPVGRRSTS